MNWSQLWLSPDPIFLPNSALIQTGLGPPFFQNSAYKKGEPQVSCGGILCLHLCVCVCVCTKCLPWATWTTLASLVSLRLQPTGGGHVVLSPIHSTSNTWSPVTYRASPTCFPCTPERPEVEDKDRERKTHVPTVCSAQTLFPGGSCWPSCVYLTCSTLCKVDGWIQGFKICVIRMESIDFTHFLGGNIGFCSFNWIISFVVACC